MFTVHLAGWESQLLETGFLAIFMCPLFSLTRLPRHTPTSWAVIWGYRWLIFRIMLGAVRGRHTASVQWVYYSHVICMWLQGLIKIRGDQCWRDLTCMNYHYEVQERMHVLSGILFPFFIPDPASSESTELLLTSNARVDAQSWDLGQSCDRTNHTLLYLPPQTISPHLWSAANTLSGTYMFLPFLLLPSLTLSLFSHSIHIID